jgi:NAD-dependent DNA ligase
MEELSKIKYSIDGMVRKREDLQMKESIEAKFAHTLNQIISGDSPDKSPNFK